MSIKIRNLSIKLCYPVENIFNDIVNQITDIKEDKIKYPDRIFYFNGEDEYICEYNQRTNYFWCNYTKFWSKFYLNDLFSYMTVKYLLNNIVEEHFKFREVTTTIFQT